MWPSASTWTGVTSYVSHVGALRRRFRAQRPLRTRAGPAQLARRSWVCPPGVADERVEVPARAAMLHDVVVEICPLREAWGPVDDVGTCAGRSELGRDLFRLRLLADVEQHVDHAANEPQ